MKRTIRTFDPAPVLARYYGMTHDEVAELLGVSGATVASWRSGRRRLNARRADQLACHHLGLNPRELWPDWGEIRTAS